MTESPPIQVRVRRIGLIAGPVLGLVVAWLLADQGRSPLGLDAAGRITAGLTAWMAVWWMTEAIPLHATALLPLAVLPTAGVLPMAEVAAPYAHPLIFLFMGGFLLALAMQRWQLDRRLALAVLVRVGARPRRIVAGFMGITAVFSMWVSNTATAVMMLPIATSVIALLGTATGRLEATDDGRVDEEAAAVREGHHFALALLLGIAYAASIGGVGTLIGTPPNLFLASYAQSELGIEIGFARWMAIGMPIVAIFLPLTWWLLTHRIFPIRIQHVPGGEQLFRRSAEGLGPIQRGEWVTLIVFTLAALAWITRPWLSALQVGEAQPFAGLSDTGIALIAALALFVIPVEGGPARRFVMDGPTALQLPWGLLLLFGGGLSLAAAIQATGVAAFLGGQVAGLAAVPAWLLVTLVVAGMIFLTEITSNTATTATLVPILAGVGPGLGLDPLLLIVPAAIAASCAFMLPVATPPNAIVFGSGRIEIGDMVRAGLGLNLIGIVLISLLAYAIVLKVLIP